MSSSSTQPKPPWPSDTADREERAWPGTSALRSSNTVQKLESAVFNDVSLGQWEVARGLLSELARGHSRDREGGENARELLKLLIMEASNSWSGSVAIPTPHHLSWLALQTYNSLYPLPEDQLPDYVRKLIEFRLLLCSVLIDSSSSAVSVSSTLCRYHSTHVLVIPGTIPEPVPPFQSAVLSFLHNILVSKPTTGHALIQSLTAKESPSPAYLSNNEALQLLYVDAIHETLEAILTLKLPSEVPETDSDSQYESDHTLTSVNQGRKSVTKECQRLMTLVYDLLSLMDPRADMGRVLVDKLFVFLLKMNHQLGPDKFIRFDVSKIYSCLVGRSTPYLVRRLHEVEEYVRVKASSVGGGAAEKSGAWSLKLLGQTEGPQDWRALFFHVYHDHKHFLECVLDLGLQLIRVGRLKEASELLSKPEFIPLRPILLLLGWDVFPVEGSGKELTEALWPSQVSLSQPLLYEGCCRLVFQVELVQWCLDKTRPHLHPPPSTPHHPHTSHRAGDMFKGLETHSVLYILHHYTPLEALDHLEVIEILKHRPRVPSLSIPLTPPPQFSRGPTPLKQTEGGTAETPGVQPGQLGGQLRPEQERDIAIFRGFRALKLVLDAVWAAVQITNGIFPSSKETKPVENEGIGEVAEGKDEERSKDDKQNEPKRRTFTARKLDFGETDNSVKESVGIPHPVPTSAPPSHEQLYMIEVLDRLQEAKACVSLLYPLNYRLEILENIFSLLFLTSEDLRPLTQSDSVRHRSSFTSTASAGRHGSTCSSNGPSGGSLNMPPQPRQSDGEFSAALSSVALLRSKHGFLVSERVAGDLLSVLQDSMFEMRAARYVLTQPTTSGMTNLQPGAIQCSINASSAQQRSAKLEQYINEARWRLQLVSSKHGIREEQRGVTSGRREDQEELSSSSVESGSEMNETDSEPEGKQVRKVKRKQLRKASSDSKSSTQRAPEPEVAPFVSDRPPSTILSSRSVQIGRVSPIPMVQSPTWGIPTSLHISDLSPTLSLRSGDRSRIRQRSPRPSRENRGVPPRQQRSPHPDSSSVQSSDQRPLTPVPPADPGVDSGEWADVDEKSPQHDRDNRRKKRLCSRSLQTAKKRRTKVSERSDGGSAHGGVVSQMLASPGSLLRMCLRHTNYSRAHEVLKMFGTENQFGKSFVQFSEKYEWVCRELAEQSRWSSTPKTSPSLTPQERTRQKFHHRSSSSSSSIHLHPDTHLHVAIANATSSSSALESLHHLLAPSSLHRMLLSGDEHLERAAQGSATLHTLSQHVPSLVMLDVVSSTKTEGQVARRIVEEASGRCQSVLESLSTTKPRSGSRRFSSGKKTSVQHDISLPGPFSLLQIFSEVSGYFSLTLPLPALSRSSTSRHPPYHSPHTLLSSFLGPLRTPSVVGFKSFQDSYRNARERLTKHLEQQDMAVPGDIITAFKQSTTPIEEPQRSLSQALRRPNLLDSMFEELLQVLDGEGRRSPVLVGSPRQRGLMRRSSSVLLKAGAASPEVGRVSTNFVLQFSHYLSQLMDLLMKCLSPSPSALSEGALLLSVLQESPSRLLGRLVFEVGVAPTRLERLMSSFHHIHMMEVLVRCCCPRLPALTLPLTTPTGVQGPVGVLALNEGECQEEAAPLTDLCAFSEKLLTNLLSLIKEHSVQTAATLDPLVSSDDLLTIYNSPKMKSLISKTTRLSSVDLRTLATPTEQTSFFSNIVNFLYAHCLMFCVAEAHGGETGVLSRSKISLGDLERSPLLRAGVLTTLGYHMGQLGLISCHDLHHSVLRRGLSPPLSARDTPLLCRISPVKPDPWFQFSPSSPDPRILFAVHAGPASSPMPLPLHPDDFSSSLKTAERRYLSRSVHVDVAAKEVTVPQRLYDHRDDFARPVWKEKYANSSLHYLPDLSLLVYLLSHVDSDLSELLQPLVTACETAVTRKHPLPVKVTVQTEEQRLGYRVLGMEDGNRLLGTGDEVGSAGGSESAVMSPRRRMSRLRSRTDVPDSTTPPQVTQLTMNKGYSFTPEVLTFVTHQNPLLAALIHLLCPPPPSPPSISLPPSSSTSSSATTMAPHRKMNRSGQATGSEEEGTTGVSLTGEAAVSEGEEREDSSRVRGTTMFAVRSRVKTQLARRTSYDHHAPLSPSLSSWQRELDDVLVQFVTHKPMQHFLRARLANFNSILPWDLLGIRPTPTGRRSRGRASSALPEPKDTLRVLALLPARGHALGFACSYSLHRLVESGRVQEAVAFLASEPAACHRNRTSLLADIALSSAFVKSYSEILSLGQSGEMASETLSSTSPSSSSSYSSPLSLLFQLSDQEMAARLVLSSLHNWPVGVCCDLLSLSSHHLSPSSPLLPTVQDKLERIQIYSTIMAKCRSLLLTRSEREKKKEQRSWSKWTDLAHDSECKPQFVLGVLLTEREFELARRWAHVHSLSQRISQQIEVDYLSTLLEGHSPDPMSAHRVLDSFLEDKLRLRVCESVLEQRMKDAAAGVLDNVETTIFILHYITSKLGKVVGETQRIKYINWLLGAKALLSLPREERQEYRSLMGDAVLLVEQLLINKKTEQGAEVVKELRKDRHISWITVPDMPRSDSAPSSLPKDETNDPFTNLFVFYAGKALEFPEPVFTSGSKPYSASTTAQSTRPTSPGHTSHPPTVPLSPLPFTEPPSRASYTHRHRRSSQAPISPTPAYHAGDSAQNFEPPSVPPPKEKWEPDSKAKNCPICRSANFGMFNRRHHCRRCGRVVCARCSPHLTAVEGYDRPQRTCKDCHSFQKTTSVEDSGQSAEYQATLASVYPALSHNQRWKLLPNDTAYNNNIRLEFYYEESPNWALCLTLVDLLLSRGMAAAYLLDRCHFISLQLVSDSRDYVNREVDQYFVIGVIQNLLWSAKLRFEEATDLSGVEICDTYLSRVDLLRQLVSSRSRVIPSIQELAKPELARRVRDRLVQEDQFELAMEVSTKCQLDTSVVWSAWGVACLRCGELAKAREKFRHCFQMSSQRGSGVTAGRRSSGMGGAGTQQLLERTVEQLEQSPLSITIKCAQPTEDWSSVMMTCMSLTEKHSDDCDLDTHRFSECLHYLQSYGGHSATVAFFVRHNSWTDACKYILDERCSEEVFVEQLYVPALKAGIIEKVQDILKALNHSLVHWEPYLTAVCRYFSQRSLYHVLYQTQLYMRDFIRAGMTCIKFFIGFSGRSTTITDLFSRRHYLTTALRHFQSALDAKQRAHGGDRTPGVGGRGRGGMGYLRSGNEDPHLSLATSTKNMSISDLKSHIATIELQMKVTEFMYRCAKASNTLQTPLTSSSSGEGGVTNSSGGVARKPAQPITLFSSGHMRAEVAVLLMLRSQDILEGFELAQSIVTTYQLPLSNIFCETSRGLAGALRYSDIRVLLECANKSSFASDSLNDEILMAAIKVLASHSKETKQVEKLVNLLRNERSKIKALVQCGKLKNAYLTAIKSRLVDEVINISQIAEKAGQLPVRDICEKWLQTNGVPRSRT